MFKNCDHWIFTIFVHYNQASWNKRINYSWKVILKIPVKKIFFNKPSFNLSWNQEVDEKGVCYENLSETFRNTLTSNCTVIYKPLNLFCWENRVVLYDRSTGCFKRSSHPEVFCKKSYILRNFAKFTGKQYTISAEHLRLTASFLTWIPYA